MVSGFIGAEPSRFVGRSEDLARIDASSRQAGDHDVARVVTIVGPGGIGKTRLAMRYASTRQWQFGSVSFCDMRDARSPSEMASVVLRTFAGDDAPRADAEGALLRTLAARAGALVVLDNVEHLLPVAASIIRRWASSSSGVRFLVTSRVALGISIERVVEIDGVLPSDAVELFVERVRARDAAFDPSTRELESIDEIVRRLARVPLAIELAAARIGVEDTTALLAHVAPLTSGDSAEAATQRAFALLDPTERELLRRCSVFRGSFGLHAADRIAGDRVHDPRAVLLALAQKNIVVATRHQPMRFTMCEGVRALAAASLTPIDATVAFRLHADLLCEHARAIASDEPLPVDAAEDRDDLHAAMRYGASHERPDVVLFTALALDALALGGGLGEEQLAHLDEALRRGAASDLGLLCRALLARSSTLYALGRLVESRRDAETALLLAIETSDTSRIGSARRACARAAFQLGDLDAARAHLACALEVERERGDALGIASVYEQMGSLHNTLGELELARDAFERSHHLAHGAGDAAGEARAFMGLAWHYFESGQREVARSHFDRALAIARRLGMHRSERIVIGYLGLIAFEEGNLGIAEAELRRAALASRRAGDLRVEGIFEGVRGGVLAALDRIAESRAAFDLADELLARNTFYQGAIRVHRGHLDLAESRVASAAGDQARAEQHIADARWRIKEAAALARRSDDARMAITILERVI